VANRSLPDIAEEKSPEHVEAGEVAPTVGRNAVDEEEPK